MPAFRAFDLVSGLPIRQSRGAFLGTQFRPNLRVSTARNRESFAGTAAPLCPARHPPQSVAACLSIVAQRILSRLGTKSRETIYGASIRAAAERATEARKEADRLAVAAWNKRMLGFHGPAQPSPTLGDAINAGYLYLEVRCLGCNTHQKSSVGPVPLIIRLENVVEVHRGRIVPD
jgi:hypothetical protein